MLEADTKGEEQMKNFIEKRLVDQTIDFYQPKTYYKVTEFSAPSNIFGKIPLIQQNRKINLQEVFSYPLGPIPWVLAEANGELKKSRKAKIMHELKKGVTRVERADAPLV